MKAYIGTQEIIKSPDYIFEPKLDGFRALCYVNSNIQFISRNDKDFNERFPELLHIRKNIKAKSAILDGEIVAFNKQGMPDIHQLKSGAETQFIVFDILMKDGKNFTKLPLIERKKILEKTVKDGKFIQKNLYTDQGEKLWREINKRKLEGIMAKEINGLYYPGKRHKTWLKVKIFNTLDCVIIGYSSGARVISSLALGLYDSAGQLHYIGQVGTGFSEEDISMLYAKLSKIKSPQNVSPVEAQALRSFSEVGDQAGNVAKQKNITWVKPKFVCEIKYQEFTPAQMIRIGVFIQLRPDKKPKECTFTAQLKTIRA